MNGIEIGINDGVPFVNGHRESPAIPTSVELQALQIVYDAIVEAGGNLNDVHLERKTDQYLSIILGEFNDFLRLKIGEKSKWISLAMWGCNDTVFFDPRFSEVKNKKTRHWKIKLNSVNDLNQLSDLIKYAYVLSVQT